MARPGHRMPLRLYLIGGCALVLTYAIAVLAGLPSTVRLGLFTLGSVAAIAAALVGIGIHRPAPWWRWLLVASQLCGLIGFVLTPTGIAPGAGEAAYLLQYTLGAAVLIVVLRRRTHGWDVPGMLDAGLVGVSAALLTWIYLIAPAATAGSTVAAKLGNAVFPLADLTLAVLGARLLLGAGPKPPAVRLLVGFLALVVVPDTVASLQRLAGVQGGEGWLELLWCTASLMLGLAALHPSITQIDARTASATPHMGPLRLTALAVASLLAPVTLFVQYLRGAPLYVPLICVTCGMLFLLVIFRLAGLVAVQRRMAITDELTGLRTRRYFKQALAAERTGLAVALVDIDHFKLVNDTYGHDGGDRALCEVARRLRDAVRPGDVVARYGGEEFAILLPHVDASEARRIAERVHDAVRRAPVAIAPDIEITVTISVGVACLPADTDDPEELVVLADQLLYLAKENGRDRVAADRPRSAVA